MKLGDWIIIALMVVIIAGFGISTQQNVNLRQEREELKNEIQELNREIGEYQAMEDFYWEFTDLLDEIYQGKINEAVLNERVHWLKYLDELRDDYVTQEYYELYVNQLKDDMELFAEVIVDYYEDTDQSMTLEEYTAQNYPALYERLLDY